MSKRVLLVTTWDAPCGIAEHSAYLIDAVFRADRQITMIPSQDALDPGGDWKVGSEPFDIIHLNYQASLHSRWTPQSVEGVKRRSKVVITYHDTGVPNSDQCKALHAVADAFVIHEPAEDLPGAYYWRQGIPDSRGRFDFGLKLNDKADGYCFKDFLHQPVLGTVGFPFPWKNYDQLAKVTARAGWALLLIAPNATDAQCDEWRALNPSILIKRNFVDRAEVVALLSGCDATAFTYVTHNTGTSGAIRQGIAARKPVIALHTCRQFRDLFHDDLAHRAIRWCETFDDVYEQLTFGNQSTFGIIALAEQDSWRVQGERYAQLYRSLL